MDITIPNHQLVVPNYGYETSGSMAVFNASTANEVLINSLQDINKNDMPLLGRSFLSSAYLMVDQDNQQFTLAGVNATNNEKIISNGPPVCQSPKSISTPAPTSSGAAGATSPPAVSPTPANTHQGISTGVVAGAAVGGVAAVALCLGAFLLLLRRRRRTRQEQLARMESEKRDPPVTGVSEPGFGMPKAEMSSDYTHQPASEMPSQRHPPYQLGPYEMPSQQQQLPYKTAHHEMPTT